jgi:hypothetical protein
MFVRAPYTVTTGASSVSIVIPELATEDVMGSTFYLIVVTAVLAVLQAPALAQENAAPPASQNPASPQNPVQGPAQAPLPQAQPSRPQQPRQQEQAQDSNQDANPDSDGRRFVFHRVDGSLLRLDMHTGAVDACTPNGSAWACVPGRDDRAAFDREMERLRRDNAVLKNALLEHGVPLPAGMTPNPPATGNWWDGDATIPRPPQTVPPTTAAPGTPALGSPQAAPAQRAPDSEIDRALNAVERGWRRLLEMMTNLRREFEK